MTNLISSYYYVKHSSLQIGVKWLNRRPACAMEDLKQEIETIETENQDSTDAKPFWPIKNGSSIKEPERIVAHMPVHKDSDIYNMKHKERGLAVIFNHKNFHQRKLNPRDGTDADRDSLVDVLRKLRFTVKVHEDLDKKDVFRVIETLAADDHSDRDCLLIAVFSHGERDLIHARDDDYKPCKLWEPFDANCCPSLAGKPKIFVIQACQGDQVDSGTVLHKARSLRTQVDSSSMDSSSAMYTVPNKADFLIVRSTVKGYYSWRNTQSGSWFIQSLCEVLEQYGALKDLLSMMTIVARKVALDKESCVPNLPQMHEKKQIPLVTSTLTRDIFFL